MNMEGGDCVERSRQTVACLAGEPVPIPGKAGRTFGHHPVQPQPIRERAVNANGGSIPQVRGLL